MLNIIENEVDCSVIAVKIQRHWPCDHKANMPNTYGSLTALANRLCGLVLVWSLYTTCMWFNIIQEMLLIVRKLRVYCLFLRHTNPQLSHFGNSLINTPVSLSPKHTNLIRPRHPASQTMDGS